ncbi:hypothetical protein D6D10_06509 [Aureobasidium pullulans]|uniref:Xylanolytic transcriptional activator regulatory domain-containing protein n=1 Tax=Aureobasidium pullulans TaxID=5580 RepID=A0A4V4J7M5_AURPU|nr:hypothetical protein D6D10_06509 [Aureobasidium pullulans]
MRSQRSHEVTEPNPSDNTQHLLETVAAPTPADSSVQIEPVEHLVPLPSFTAADGTEPVISSRSLSPEPRLMNPFALGASAYAPASRGDVPVYLGTSSNWAFGRRVLVMSHEQILGSMPGQESLFFQSEIYDLGWDGTRGPFASTPPMEPATLPTADHAIYLINAVKFHCGQMFHLFDEETFMRCFAIFHDPTVIDKSSLMPLWFVHYLLILAFGKAFLARGTRGRRPPGAELFVQAMQLLPDTTFLCIRQALGIALEHGMHTDMQSQHIPEHHVRRCRNIFWTVYILDRQLSSLMGLPTSIRDEDISAELPYDPLKSQKAMALDIQVKLSRVIAKIANSKILLAYVYGPEGRLDVRYVANTKDALKDIASVTDQLHRSFDIMHDAGRQSFSRDNLVNVATKA